MMAISSPGSDQITYRQELIRKATHMGSLVFPLSYQFLGFNKQSMLALMIPLALLMILIDLSRLRRWRFWTGFAGRIGSPVIRGHEKSGDFTGATYILIAFCCTIALYDKPIAVAALSFTIVGDTLAALIGRRFGRLRFGRKSLEGSLACLAGCGLVAWIVPGLLFYVGISGAIVATIAETMTLGIDDNVTMPVLSGLFMTLIAKLVI